MNETSPILLVGVGTAGAAMAHGVMRAFAGDMRCLVADTDASSARPSAPFLLLGGDMPRNVRLDFFQNTLPYGILFGVLAGWPPLAAILDRAYALFPPNPK